MRIEILPEARDDLLAGFEFYERQVRGLGNYFRDSLDSDIESLAVRGGAHGRVFWVLSQFEQTVPICDLLSSGGKCGPNPRDFGLPPKAFVDSPKVARRLTGTAIRSLLSHYEVNVY